MTDAIQKRARYILSYFGERAPAAADLFVGLALDIGDEADAKTWEKVRSQSVELLRQGRSPVTPWELLEAA
jgi:hypothetical protein